MFSYRMKPLDPVRSDMINVARGYGDDHLHFGKCDPRKCPEEINRQRRGVLPLRRALWRQVREKDCQLMAQFRASS